MRIALFNKISLLKFGTNKDFRDKKDNVALDKKAANISASDIQGIYGEAFINMQSDAALLNRAIFDLSLSLKKMSDEEFNNLDIKQTFEKNDFIAKTVSIVENLSEEDRHDVCDYFGFKLYQNEENPVGFSISGYPVLSNNKKALKGFDLSVQKAICKMQPVVKMFLENNPVICNDKNIEKELNLIVKVFPELRVLIGKKQHKSHSFDVMKHSLKVMQKIVQNSEFDKLNKSDKRILLIASLFHDIRKTEGKRDPNHATSGAFDAYHITKRLNLAQSEEIKLYSLIKNHGWLNFVNRPGTPEEVHEAQKAAAFDMRQGNLFDMMKIFTEADLKSTKDSDISFNKHKEKFEAHSDSISRYIQLMYQCL